MDIGALLADVVPPPSVSAAPSAPAPVWPLSPADAHSGEDVQAAAPAIAPPMASDTTVDERTMPGLAARARRGRSMAWSVGVAGALIVVGAGATLALRGGGGAASNATSTASAEKPLAAAEPAEKPAPVIDPSAASSASPAASSQLLVVCVPECDRVLLNGQPMTAYPEPVALAPGTYGVGVGRSGYGGQFRQLVLKPGQKETVSFTLSHPHAPPKKPCGKFLKRCE
jgi:hypothetical protein